MRATKGAGRNAQGEPVASVKSDAELRKVGRQWPPSVWEAYLATLEVRREEDYVLPPFAMDNFSTEQHISLAFSMASMGVSKQAS